MIKIKTKTITGNADAIGREAARIILSKAKEIAKKKADVVLALPGGRSVATLFSELKKSKDPVWKIIHIFLVDERAMKITSEESNFKLINESFAESLVKRNILPKENLHPLFIKPDKEDYGASEYYDLLARFGGRFDIAVLASGEDGHVGALYPGRKEIAQNNGFNFVFLPDSPKPPAKRITATPALIRMTELTLLLFIGDAKKDAYNKFKNDFLPISACPAKLGLGAKQLVVFSDINE
jgi:6-phosphogluconolactonase